MNSPVPVERMTKFPNEMVLKVLVNGAGAMSILLFLPLELELEAGQPLSSTAEVLDDDESEEPLDADDDPLDPLNSEDELPDDPEDPEPALPEDPELEDDEPLPALAGGFEPGPARGSSGPARAS